MATTIYIQKQHKVKKKCTNRRSHKLVPSQHCASQPQASDTIQPTNTSQPTIQLDLFCGSLSEFTRVSMLWARGWVQ